MTRSVYVIGGAGTGKSTFTQLMLDISNRSMGPLEDLHTKPNSRGTMITLRGHQVGLDGMYLGCMRDSFPGTDGLDRVSYIPGEEWLIDGHVGGTLPDFIVAEGATLAARRFIRILHKTTDLLLVHMVVPDFVKELWIGQRGSGQDEKFVLASATRSYNLYMDMQKEGVSTRLVDASDPDQWEQALEIVGDHLGF